MEKSSAFEQFVEKGLVENKTFLHCKTCDILARKNS